ncbi:hypothetical protein PR048_003086 [Dryococelus australis]|uniref:Maturase K n=1 Tax=Dryococelus australis TaxID=614101 RepID=A0ABQ9IM21_9NEOP|nr:hypothetical protein PR048_003086 [Dryococelus australis]
MGRRVLLGSRYLMSDITDDEFLFSLWYNSTAPGIYGITYRHLWEMSTLHHTCLKTIFNYVYRMGKIPSHWKLQIVIRINKPNKVGCEPETFRPITLMSTLEKTFPYFWICPLPFDSVLLPNLLDELTLLGLPGPLKTKIRLFTRNFIQGDGVIVTYANTNLPLVSSHKYFGIYLNLKLNWLPQMKHRTARVHTAISVFKAVSHTCWGGDPKMLLLIYISFTRPHMDYGSLFMRCVSLHLRLQTACLRRCLGLMHSTSITAMHVEANILPYFLLHDYIATK